MRVWIAASSALAVAGCAAQLAGGPQVLATSQSGGGDFRLAMTSLQEARFAEVIRQQYDFSCGSAALATLLRFHYDYDVAEENAFRGMWARGDQNQIRKLGFSLLDMKRWLASRGVPADGFRSTSTRSPRPGCPGSR